MISIMKRSRFLHCHVTDLYPPRLLKSNFIDRINYLCRWYDDTGAPRKLAHNFSSVYCPQLFTSQTFNHQISLHTEYILLILYVKVFIAFISLNFIILEKLISNKILRLLLSLLFVQCLGHFLDLFF